MASLTLFFVPFLGPWASIALRDVTLGFVHLIELGNESFHVAEVEDHDENKNDWADSSVSFTMVFSSVVSSSISL